MSEKGKFIVFEGIDGSGKSTQMKQYGKYLKSRGVECYLTCEPTDSPFGALLRSCMTGRLETDEQAIAALFAADRIDHIFNPVNGIAGKLEQGVTVLCDRYYFSSFAYNGGMVSLDWVMKLNEPAVKSLPPDLVVYIDLPPEESMRRVAKRGEAERYETFEKQAKIREKYFEVFETFKGVQKIAVVASEEDKDLTQKHIREAADGLFGF